MKTDNFTKVLLTSIVILLGIIVVKDIDLPPKVYGSTIEELRLKLKDIQSKQSMSNKYHLPKYQLACAYQECILLNTITGMAKVLQVEPPKNAIKGTQSMTHKYGKMANF
jgi:hypothetical protein